MKHFSVYPKIEYSNNTVVNMTARAKIRDLVLQNKVVFYDYVLDDYERPDILATKYYGMSDYTWLLFYANNVFDPFYDWLLSPEEFKKFLLNKYKGTDPKDCALPLGTIKQTITSGTNLTYQARTTPLKEGDQVISPSGQIRNVMVIISSTQVTIDLPFNNDLASVTCKVRNKNHSYYNVEGLEIDFITWKSLGTNEKSQKTYFDFELEKNEAKRNIKVIDSVFTTRIINEFDVIFR